MRAPTCETCSSSLLCVGFEYQPWSRILASMHILGLRRPLSTVTKLSQEGRCTPVQSCCKMLARHCQGQRMHLPPVIQCDLCSSDGSCQSAWENAASAGALQLPLLRSCLKVFGRFWQMERIPDSFSSIERGDMLRMLESQWSLPDWQRCRNL